MNSGGSNTSKHLLAYFSHSYRPEEKDLNLFFWELLSKHKLYFTVDSKEKNIDKSSPMDITYLEWMMRRSVCFVAVIPYRENLPPYNCSPYQVFENSLALRARKPRLIFVDKRLDPTIFGAHRGGEEVCFFQHQAILLEEDKEEFAALAERMTRKVRTLVPLDSGGRKPVGLLVDTGIRNQHETAYTSDTIGDIRRTVQSQGFTFKPIRNPHEFEQKFLFLREIESYGVLISEVRQPYIPLDILGLAHSQCIPTIHICYVKNTEDSEKLEAVMHLPFDEDKWSDQSCRDLPAIFSKYQIDNDMEPVIFWKQVEDLSEKISIRLKKINEKRDDLITEEQARQYFLRIGRKSQQVFISNANTQNHFAIRLGRELKQEAVEIFHYKEEGAIQIGSRDWYSSVIKKINNSAILIALVDKAYLESRWCMSELQEAMFLFKEGRIKIHAYLLDEKADQLPKHLTEDQNAVTMAQKAEFDVETYRILVTDLYKMQLTSMENRSDTSADENLSAKIKLIIKNSINFLETGNQVQLTSEDRERLINILAGFPLFTVQDERKKLLQDASLPQQFIKSIRITDQNSEIAVAEIIDDLAGFEEEITPGSKALGLLLLYLWRLIDLDDDKTSLMKMIQSYELIPENLLPKGENFEEETTRKREQKAFNTKSAQIFLSYVKEDREKVKILYKQLQKAGYMPWMDEDILPGENWDFRIRKAIKRSDFFLACLSPTAVNKRSYFQEEIGRALELWKRQLEEDIYLIPVLLEKCEVPGRLGGLQKVYWFEEDGLERLLKALKVGIERKSGKETS